MLEIQRIRLNKNQLAEKLLEIRKADFSIRIFRKEKKIGVNVFFDSELFETRFGKVSRIKKMRKKQNFCENFCDNCRESLVRVNFQ